jgi:hypothetical protein
MECDALQVESWPEAVGWETGRRGEQLWGSNTPSPCRDAGGCVAAGKLRACKVNCGAQVCGEVRCGGAMLSGDVTEWPMGCLMLQTGKARRGPDALITEGSWKSVYPCLV